MLWIQTNCAGEDFSRFLASNFKSQFFSVDEGIEMLFEICRTDEGKISVKLFLEELNKFGIRKDDQRLTNMMKMLNMWKPNSVSSVEVMNLDTQLFKTVISENYVMINKMCYQSFIIPNFDVFSEKITKIYEKVRKFENPRKIIILPSLTRALS